MVHQGKLHEDESRWYFQQLIDAVDYCHSKGVHHRDLKHENLLLDSRGNLKVSDFGLSALSQQGVGLLHTTCGTPNYVAPEINTAEFSCPPWFSSGAKLLIHKILDPNPKSHFHIEGIKNDPWSRRNYVPVGHGEQEEVNLEDVQAVFNNIETRFVSCRPTRTIIASIEAVAESMSLKVHSQNYKMRLEGVSSNKMGQFTVVLEVFEVSPSPFMVDDRKVAGDTLEYHKLRSCFLGL